MSDQAHPPAGGGGGGMGNAWGYTILAIVIIFSGVILHLTGQLDGFLSMLQRRMGPILIFAAIIGLFMATRGDKK